MTTAGSLASTDAIEQGTHLADRTQAHQRLDARVRGSNRFRARARDHHGLVCRQAQAARQSGVVHSHQRDVALLAQRCESTQSLTDFNRMQGDKALAWAALHGLFELLVEIGD